MSEQVTGTIQEIKSALKARLTNPLVGTFALSWIIVNHRMIFVLFSDKPIGWRFGYIDSVMYADWLAVASKGFVVPAAITLAYLYLLPRLTRPVYRRVLEDQREMNDIKRRTDGEQLISVEDRRRALLEAKQLKDDASVALRKAEVIEGQAALRVEEIELQLAKREREARAEVAATEKDLAIIREKLCLERACNAMNHNEDESKNRLCNYLKSREFIIEFESSRGLIKETLQFGEDGVVLPIAHSSSAITRWFFNGSILELSLKYGDLPVRLTLSPSTGDFNGTYNRRTATLRRSKPEKS